MAKIDEAPTYIKKSKNGQKIVIKHFFWTCWIHKTRMQVLGWVVERGATWGGGKGVKSDQIQVLMVVVKKNKGIQKYQVNS